MIAKLAVLLWVQHLKQRGRRVTSKVRPQFVYFVEHEDRVPGFHPPQRLDDTTRQRADVGTAVATDLRFVTHAAQRLADKLTSQRPCNRLPQAGLARAGWPDKTEDDPLPLAPDQVGRLLLLPLLLALLPQSTHRQVFQDALLDIVQVVMVFVEHLPGVRDIQIVLALDVPRQAGQPIQVRANDTVLSGNSGQFAQPVQFAAGLFLRLLRHPPFLDLLAKLLHLHLLLVGLAQLLLDGLHLLAQEVFALGILHLRLGLTLDLATQFEYLQFLRQQAHQQA